MTTAEDQISAQADSIAASGRKLLGADATPDQLAERLAQWEAEIEEGSRLPEATTVLLVKHAAEHAQLRLHLADRVDHRKGGLAFRAVSVGVGAVVQFLRKGAADLEVIRELIERDGHDFSPTCGCAGSATTVGETPGGAE